MSAMDDMLANMLKKALPAEVMQLLSPENVKEFGEKINAFITDIRERLERIESKLERIENGGSDDNDERGGGIKRAIRDACALAARDD